MEKKRLVIKPGMLLSIVVYLGSLLLVMCGGFLFYKYMIGDLISEAFLGIQILGLLIYSISIIAGIVMGVHFFNFRIVLDQDGIYKEGLFTKRLEFNHISKVTLKNGLLIVRGDRVKSEISIGNLYSNFNSAIRMLASKIDKNQNLEFSGNKELIKNYFTMQSE